MKASDLLEPWEKMPEGGVRILTEATDRDVAQAKAMTAAIKISENPYFTVGDPHGLGTGEVGKLYAVGIDMASGCDRTVESPVTTVTIKTTKTT